MHFETDWDLQAGNGISFTNHKLFGIEKTAQSGREERIR